MKYNVTYTYKRGLYPELGRHYNVAIIESDTLAGVGKKLSDQISTSLRENDYIEELEIINVQPIRYYTFLCNCFFKVFDAKVCASQQVYAKTSEEALNIITDGLKSSGVDPSVVRIVVNKCSQ